MKLIAKSTVTALLACLVLAPAALANGLSDQLITAIIMDDTSGVQAAIDKGADVNRKDADGVTPLMETASYGRPEIARMLIDKGANMNVQDKYGNTALMRAAIAGRAEVAKLLIEKGADINVKDKLGDTALNDAEKWMSADIAAMLKKAGAK